MERGRVFQERRQELDISRMLRSIKKLHADTFVQRGYSEIPAIGVASRADDTVQFIGSTISALKPFFLENRIPQEGLCITQECIRTQSEVSLYDDEIFPEYNTAFSIVGGIAQATRLSDVVSTSVDFFQRFGIEKKDLLARISSQDQDLIASSQIETPEVCVDIDSRPENYYRWIYGIPGVGGRGLTYAIRQRDGKYKDIGNIIMMEGGGYAPAVQWGYGVETFLARAESLPQPIAASSISTIVKYEPGLRAKYADTLSACFAMMKTGVVPGNTGRSKSLRNYLKGLSYLRRCTGISQEELETHLRKYGALEANLDQYSEKMMIFLKKHEEKVRRCFEFLKKTSEGRTIAEISSMLDQASFRGDIGNKYGVHTKEMYKMIEYIKTIL